LRALIRALLLGDLCSPLAVPRPPPAATAAAYPTLFRSDYNPRVVHLPLAAQCHRLLLGGCGYVVELRVRCFVLPPFHWRALLLIAQWFGLPRDGLRHHGVLALRARQWDPVLEC